jgi:predicted 3-demethylubiquinone-9 3-methyltransferase (glyoxalase superfamily)
MPTITPFLWFDNQAEEAANFYASVFADSKIIDVSRYGDAGPGPEGTVMTVTFELEGQEFIALNGGPHVGFNDAVSFVKSCADQDEVDQLWAKLSEGGEEGPCGWLKDRYGLSWQIVPTALTDLLNDPDREKAGRVMKAMLGMKKIDVQGLRAAYDQG